MSDNDFLLYFQFFQTTCCQTII